jgi:cyclic nucleotide-binding protein
MIMSKLDRLSEFSGAVTVGIEAMDANRNFAEETYRVWACDNQVYGPVTWSALVQWVEEGRVLRDSWIYLEAGGEWRPAHKIGPLHDYFPPGETTIFLHKQAAEEGGIAPEELRQFAILSSLSNQELAQLVRLGEVVHALPGDIIIKRGDPGDALFFVLEGAVRARIFVGGEEKSLAKIAAGEFFGDMAMFTQSPRSADVVAEVDTRLLRFGADSFRLLIGQNPAAAAPMLFAIAGTMAHRILEDNQRFQKEVAAEFVWR